MRRVPLGTVVGPPGEDGVGVPTGGTSGQVLFKNSNDNYDTKWDDPPEGGVTSFNGRTGDISPRSGDYSASDVGAVPTSRTVNSKSLSSDISLTATDVGADPAGSAATAEANAKNASRPVSWTPTATEVGAIPSTEKGTASGVAELDSNGKVPSSQLPSYVDDVLEYNDVSAFPETGETGKIYVATGTNKTYRWSGSGYVEISASLALGETSSTAYRGDRGKTAYDHSQISSGNPHGTVAGDISFTPPSGMTSTNVQSALSDLNSAKQAALQNGTGTTVSGNKVNVDLPIVEITSAGYDALTEEQRNADVAYLVTGRGANPMPKRDIYSTDEVVVGTWIDGKPIYRKVIQTSTPSNVETPTIVYDASPLNIDYVIDIYGIIAVSYSDKAFRTIMSCTGYESISAVYVYGGKINALLGKADSGATNKPASIIIEYTKTTD